MTTTAKKLKDIFLAAAHSSASLLIEEADKLKYEGGDWEFECAVDDLRTDEDVTMAFVEVWSQNNWAGQSVFQHVYDGEAERLLLDRCIKKLKKDHESL